MKIPFVKTNTYGVIASFIFLVVSILSLSFKGLTFGLDFTGGVSLELKYEEKADLEGIRQSISKIDNANFVVLNFGSDEKVLIKFQNNDELAISADTVIKQLTTDGYLSTNEDDGLGKVDKSSTIDAQIGDELRDNGGIAILVAMFVILIYIILTKTIII